MSLIESLLLNLNDLLKVQGLSKAELARRAGLPQTTVSRVFNALNDGISPSLETLEGIARGFGVSIALLFAGTGGKVPTSDLASAKFVARQLGQLTEDYLLSTAEGRAEISKKARECVARALNRGL